MCLRRKESHTKKFRERLKNIISTTDNYIIDERIS